MWRGGRVCSCMSDAAAAMRRLKELYNVSLSVYRKLAWFGAATCFLIIVLGSLLTRVEVVGDLGSDKFQHLLVYGALAAFLLSTGPLWMQRVLVVLGGCVLLGGAIEIIQPFVGRHGSWLDVAVNAAGAMLGFLIAWLGYRVMIRRA